MQSEPRYERWQRIGDSENFYIWHFDTMDAAQRSVDIFGGFVKINVNPEDKDS
jgi:hypothetical protein